MGRFTRYGRWIGLLLASLAAWPACPQTMPTSGQLVHRFVVDQPAPLASNAVLLERLLTPRERERQLAALAAKGTAPAAYPLDLSTERFSIYLPATEPPAGYGLLVFIPPWEDARLPLGWAAVLDHEGMIFVTAHRSGNEESIAGRRIPLALTAAHAVAARYRVDRQRTYISGFSGGSRVALRTAIAFPDVFAGALLNAGSDPIGAGLSPLPAPALMALLQRRVRIVFVSGENDPINLSQDAMARKSLSDWCIDATRGIVRPHSGHEVMDPSGLAEALAAMDRPFPTDPARNRRCRTAMELRMQRARTQAAALRAQTPTPQVEAQLDRLDQQFGALLEPETAPAEEPLN